MLGILAGHLAGDYLLQNDWMAQGKKRSSWICAVHCLIYTVCVLAIGGFESFGIAWTFLAIFIPHFLIDRWGFVRWWMGFYGQSDFAKPPMAPWSFIAVDNSMHIVCLWIVQTFMT